MISFILFLCVVWLLVWAVRSTTFGTVLALIMAAGAWYYHRKWAKQRYPERYQKKGMFE